MSKESLFNLINVTKGYQRGTESISIFDNLSLDIEKGDFVSIMGPSGSGKTTLLNLLGGLDSVDEGRILFCDEPFDSLSERKLSSWRSRNVGFIFQFYNLMPVLTAQENVELPLLLHNLSAKERRDKASIALELVGLQSRNRHFPRELSGGQQQRVAIARAIVTDPKLILCDEPTGDLDRDSADEALNLLGLLNEEFNKTIVMVTHDRAAAKYSSTRLVLDKGQFLNQSSLSVNLDI